MVSTSLCYIYIYNFAPYIYFYTSQFFHPLLHHFMICSYYLVPDYPVKMYKFIQRYQVTEEGFLSQFEKVEVIKGIDEVEVTSWAVINFSFFNMFQYSPNKIDRRGLVQKNNNLNNAIFGYFGLMHLWRAKAIKGSTVFPFEEVTSNLKKILY